MQRDFIITTHFKVTSQEVYDAWLNSEAHTRMTGGLALVSERVGETFSAWDGYITGVNRALEPGKRILQEWRTTEFQDSDPSSILEIELKDVRGGCELTLTHSNIPSGQSNYEAGWEHHYFEPMRVYFSARTTED